MRSSTVLKCIFGTIAMIAIIVILAIIANAFQIEPYTSGYPSHSIYDGNVIKNIQSIRP